MDIASKTATVKVSDLPAGAKSLQIVVAAYNAELESSMQKGKDVENI